MSIFSYSDYKSFLRDIIATFPKKGRGQVNQFANHLNVHPTLVSQVLNGDRDFSTEQIYKLCSYLGLQPLESDFLILLLQQERAGTNDLKKYYKNKIEDVKKASNKIANRITDHRSLSELEQSVFYSSWIYIAVWLFLSVEEGQTLDSVSQRFEISRAQAGEILNFLKNAQLCEDRAGLFKMKSQHIHLEFGSPFLGRHHANWLMKALQRIDDLKEDEMIFTSPFSISRKDFIKIREELMKVIKSTSAMIKDSPAEDIACLNLELFWIQK